MSEGAADSIEEVLKAAGYDALDEGALSPPPNPTTSREICKSYNKFKDCLYELMIP